MTFSPELFVWLVVCAAGLLTSLGSLRYSVMILQAVRVHQAEVAVIEGTLHLFRTELERVIGWAMFLTVGLLAVMDDHPAAPPTTAVGTFAIWLLIATAALWSYKTASDYFYTRQRFRAIDTP